MLLVPVLLSTIEAKPDWLLTNSAKYFTQAWRCGVGCGLLLRWSFPRLWRGCCCSRVGAYESRFVRKPTSQQRDVRHPATRHPFRWPGRSRKHMLFNPARPGPPASILSGRRRSEVRMWASQRWHTGQRTPLSRIVDIRFEAYWEGVAAQASLSRLPPWYTCFHGKPQTR